MKKILMITLLSLMGQVTFAQLSTRTNAEPYNFKVGTRTTEETCGLYVGPSFSEIKDMTDNKVNWRGLPYLNFKYYKTDKLVYKIGIQLYSKSESLSGEQEISNSTIETKGSNSETYFRLSPGVEYHFNSNNLLDVYTGAFLPIGYDHFGLTNEAGDYKNNITQTPFVFGLGGYIGLQTFIADLPLAIGLEYGLSYYGRFGMQYKHTITDNKG